MNYREVRWLFTIFIFKPTEDYLSINIIDFMIKDSPHWELGVLRFHQTRELVEIFMSLSNVFNCKDSEITVWLNDNES